MRQMTYADLERLYLDGKISAKEYQKLLADIKSRPIITPAPAPAKQAPVRQAPPPVAATANTNRPPAAVTTTNRQDISDVEAKMDALIRARAAREKATNTPPRPATAGPKSKRDRLNDLLRLYIEGKISETELNERRSKIIAEPD